MARPHANCSMTTSTTLDWLTVPVVPSGYWGASSRIDVTAVLSSARAAALTGLPLDATRVPSRIDVLGSQDEAIPMTIACDNPDGSATIRVNAPDRLWAKLSYNFAHELGHVLAGSWHADAVPAGPSHWLEEAVVEAFAIHTLRRMAERWVTAPPYPNWSTYSGCLRKYAEDRLSELRHHPLYATFITDGATWFRGCHDDLAASLAVTEHVWPAIPWLVDRYGEEEMLVADLSGLNRWPERARLSLNELLDRWEGSAAALRLPARLPGMLRRQLL